MVFQCGSTLETVVIRVEEVMSDIFYSLSVFWNGSSNHSHWDKSSSTDTLLGKLVASVSLLSCSLCFVAHVTLSCFWANKLMMMMMMMMMKMMKTRFERLTKQVNMNPNSYLLYLPLLFSERYVVSSTIDIAFPSVCLRSVWAVSKQRILSESVYTTL